jgi:hypothetical protein
MADEGGYSHFGKMYVKTAPVFPGPFHFTFAAGVIADQASAKRFFPFSYYPFLRHPL